VRAARLSIPGGLNRSVSLLQSRPALLQRHRARSRGADDVPLEGSPPAALLQFDNIKHVLGQGAETEPPHTTLRPEETRTQAPQESTDMLSRESTVVPPENPKFKYGEQRAFYTTTEPPVMVSPVASLSEGELAALKTQREQKQLDCEVSDWSEWGDCQDDPKDGLKSWIQKRTRIILNPQHEGGKPCPIDFEVSRSCRYGAA